MGDRLFGAVDIGASGGRVVAGVVTPSGSATLHTVHRFPNAVVRRGGHLRWDITGLHAQVLEGLRRLAHEFPTVESIGIDTWAVDYALLDVSGTLVSQPVSYRDPRTETVLDAVHQRVPAEQLYAVNGLQFLPFTTLYQLAAERRGPLWERAEHVVLLPDLLAYWLTGVLATERTNASTTGLLDISTGEWSEDLLEAVGVPGHMLPSLENPGTVRGALLPAVVAHTGLSARTVVTTVGSHDTASAVAAVPATGPSFAYVSSGTWSLVGLELDKPVLTAESRQANFSNEGGVDGRTRFLRNVGGLWLLQESMRHWSEVGLPSDLESVLAEAESLPPGGPVVDVDDTGFIAPDDMPARIASAAERQGYRAPSAPAEVARCVLDSLASAYARTVEQASALSGQEVQAIHVVGGGSRNHLLCQLTADLSGTDVVAGPVEATALGNVLVQARAHGAAPNSLEELRASLARTQHLRRHHPS